MIYCEVEYKDPIRLYYVTEENILSFVLHMHHVHKKTIRESMTTAITAIQSGGYIVVSPTHTFVMQENQIRMFFNFKKALIDETSHENLPHEEEDSQTWIESLFKRHLEPETTLEKP